MDEGRRWQIDLMGSYRHKVDAKGRLALPAQFRKYLPTDLVVTVDMKGTSLRVYTLDDFNSWIERFIEDKFGGDDLSSTRQEKTRRALKRRGSIVSVDSAGRIVLGKEQREQAGIDGEVEIVGNTGYFEIWNAGALDEEDADFDLASLMG